MRRTEGIVDIYIRQARQFLGESRVVFGLFVVETHVFQHNDLAVLHLRNAFFRVLADNVLRHLDFLAECLGEVFSDRSEGILHVEFTLRAAQVGAEDDLCAMLVQILDGRQRAHDAGFVGDFAGLLVHGDVEIHTHQYAFALEILNVFNATFIHGYTLLLKIFK